MRPGLLPLVICLPVLGCQTVPSDYRDLGQPRQVRAFIADRQSAAARHESNGAWRDALREWQTIDAISPGDASVDRELQRLKGELELRFSRHRQVARQAFAQGRLRDSKEQWLAALALRPDDQEAIVALKDIEARLAYAAMAAEPEIAKGSQSEVDAYTAQRQQAEKDKGLKAARKSGSTRSKAVATTAEIPKQRASELLSKGRYEAALRELLSRRESKGANPELDGQIAEMRRVLAERHYARGVAAFRDARYDEAVNEFELVLRYEPDHHKARFYHSSAEALSKP